MSSFEVFPIKTIPEPPTEGDEPNILKPKYSRKAAAFGTWCFALIWNGVLWSVTYAMSLHDRGWGPFLFLALFNLVGLGAIVMAIRCTLQLFNPTTTVVCSNTRVVPGGEYEFSWLHQGRAERISSLEILLVGEEQVRYRQGTSTRNETNPFYRETILHSTEPTEIVEGFKLITLPENTMHTFNAPNNSILWSIHVKGKIRAWPDIDDRFDLIVYPPSNTIAKGGSQ